MPARKKKAPVTKTVTRKKAAPARKKIAPARKTVKKKTVRKKVAPTKKVTPTKKTVKKKTAPAKKKAASKKKTIEKKVAPAKRRAARAQMQDKRARTLRLLLIAKREELVREAQTEITKHIKGENRQMVETALDSGDWSVVDLAEDISFRRLGSHRETLLKIDEALRKLQEGTYGQCEECEDDISSERLKVIPFAINCRDCQEKIEDMTAAMVWEGLGRLR